MRERTRTIWEGRCPNCDENGVVPEGTDAGKTLALDRWCEKCKVWVNCIKVSWTGPELEPMLPSVHHIWCNGQKGPVKGCRWCAPLNEKGEYDRDGLWVRYPYDPTTGPAENFMEQHFPNNIRRT